MSIAVIALALAVQAAGQEITTFHPLPSQKEEQANQPRADKPAAAAASAEAAPAAAKPEEIKVLSVRSIPPTANVRFVPSPEEKPE